MNSYASGFKPIFHLPTSLLFKLLRICLFLLQEIDKQIEKEKKESGQALPGTAPQPSTLSIDDVPEHILTTGIEDSSGCLHVSIYISSHRDLVFEGDWMFCMSNRVT